MKKLIEKRLENYRKIDLKINSEEPDNENANLIQSRRKIDEKVQVKQKK